MDDAQAAGPQVPPHVARFRSIRPRLTAEQIAHLRRLLGPAPQKTGHPQSAASAVRRPAVITDPLERKAS